MAGATITPSTNGAQVSDGECVPGCDRPPARYDEYCNDHWLMLSHNVRASIRYDYRRQRGDDEFNVQLWGEMIANGANPESFSRNG